MTEELEKTPSIGISYQITVWGGRQLVLQSFIDRNCSKEELDKLLDKLHDAGERQFAYGKVDEIKLMLEQELKNAAQHQFNLDEVLNQAEVEWSNGGRRGNVMLTEAQKKRQHDQAKMFEDTKLRITKATQDLQKWEAVLAG